MVAVLFNVDDEAGSGSSSYGNDEVLAAAQANPDVLIPFGSVDPHKGKLGVREACRADRARHSRLGGPTPTSRRSGPTTARGIRSTR